MTVNYKQKFLDSMVCKPLLLSQEEQIRFEAFVDKVLNSELNVDENLLLDGYTPSPIENLEYDPSTGVGVLNVTGLLVDKYDPFMKYYYGATSYEELVADTKTMLDAGAHTIIQYNNSGGGQAYNLFNTANEIRSLLDEKEAVMIAYSDGITASAAFGLAAVSDEIVSNPDSEIGSVGVVVSLLDTSKYMANEGLKRIFITAGKGKVPYNDKGEFTQEFLDEVQAGVDSTYQKFTSHISTHRPITKDKLVEVGAKVFPAGEALSVGYIDKQMTRKEFTDYLHISEDKGKQSNMSFLSNLITPKAKKETQMSKDILAAEDQLAEVRTAVEAEYAQKLATDLEAALTTARTEFEAALAEKETTLNAEIASLKASLEAFQEEKANKEKADKEAAQAKRVEQLSELLGDAQGKALAAAYEQLSDEVFAATVKALGVTTKAQAEALEKEQGEEGAKVETQTPEQASQVRVVAELEKQFGKKQ